MYEFVSLILVFSAGWALGMFFFGGLWYTVKKAAAVRNPAAWFFISSVIRFSAVLSGFYFIAPGGWQHILLSLTGFVTARYIVAQLTDSENENKQKSGRVL